MSFLPDALDLLKYIIPAAFCVLTVYLVLRQQLQRHEAEIKGEMRLKAFSTYLPLRIAAYERAVLYLERIHPISLLKRVDPQNLSARLFAEILYEEINSEYDHNIVQQIYISDAGWSAVISSRNEVLTLVRRSLKELKANATGEALRDKLLKEIHDTEEEFKCVIAIRILKGDVVRSFSNN